MALFLSIELLQLSILSNFICIFQIYGFSYFQNDALDI